MAIRVDLAEGSDAADQLAAYVERAAADHERILVSREGKPLAAVVSVEDLERLEGREATTDREGDARDVKEGDEAVNRARYRAAMEKAGLVRQWPTGEGMPAFKPVKLDGPPLSEQVIADRR